MSRSVAVNTGPICADDPALEAAKRAASRLNDADRAELQEAWPG